MVASSPIPPYAITKHMQIYLDSVGTIVPNEVNRSEKICTFCGKRDGSFAALALFESPASDAKFNLTWSLCCDSCYKLGPVQLEGFRNRLNRRGLKTQVIHKGNALFMTDRLKRYLDSRGTILPHDFETYRKGGINQDTCLFCKDIPADYPIYQYMRSEAAHNIGLVKVPTQTFCCMECFSESKEMYLDHSNLDPRLFDDTPYNLRGNALERIRKYVIEGTFTDEVELYYQHRIGTKKDLSAPLKEHCYFCSKHLYSGYKILDVPVRVSNYFTGGRVRYCKSCEHEKNSLELTATNPADWSVLTRLDQCKLCKIQYAVNVFEFKNRETAGTLLMHMCPSCCFKANVAGENNETFGKREDKWSRYSECNCEYCHEYFVVDLTIASTYLKRKYVSKDTKLCCSVCNYGGRFPIFVSQEVTNPLSSKVRCYQIGEKVLFRYFRDTTVIQSSLKRARPEEVPFILYER